MGDVLIDLENWMHRLPESVRRVPIIYLAIPGSHNSMTYGISSSSGLAPDAEDIVRRMYHCCPWFVRRWAITQKINTVAQLNLGIRYFDLRIAADHSKTSDRFFFVHGLYSLGITQPLKDIKSFLDAHPNEFIVLDFQHFYDCTAEYHAQLCQEILNVFGSAIYSRADGHLDHLSLLKAQDLNKQMVIIYRYKESMPAEFWPDYYWPTPWPNVTSINKLKERLENFLQRRPRGCGFVTQCILTPSPEFIAFRFYGSLRKVAEKVNRKMLAWIEDQRPGHGIQGTNSDVQKPTANVFIADFTDLKNGDFSRTVINLNRYLNESYKI